MCFDFSPVSIHPYILQDKLGLVLKFDLKPGWHIYAPNQKIVNSPRLEGVSNVQSETWKKPLVMQTPLGQVKGYEKEAWVIFHTKDLLTTRISGQIKTPVCSDTECRLIEEKVEWDPLKTLQKNELFGLESSFSWHLLVFAFLGGLLLNIMPCVLPILSMKILSLVRTSKKSKLQFHGLAFALGLSLSLLSLATALLILRQQGIAKGWGFHLQYPAFVCGLMFLFFTIMLNMWRVFEFKGFSFLSLPKTPYLSSFGEGVLIVFVSAPCTAPFMGTAIATALQSSTLEFLAIFWCLGLGLASPFLLLCLIPKWVKYLPKTGAWINTLKDLFGFCFLGTLLWLSWVFSHQTTVDQLLLLWEILAFYGLFLWALGKWVTPISSKGDKFKGLFVTGMSVLGMLFLYQQNFEEIPFVPYTEELVESLQKDHKPYFINFTAKWCLTCQTNRKWVLETRSVRKAFKDKNVTYIVADWTGHDPKITRILESYGRIGIPFYILFTGKEILQFLEVLSEKSLLDAIYATRLSVL